MWNRLTGWFTGWLGLMVMAGLIMMALARLWQPGITSGDDTLISIYRIFALHQSWQQGLLYPRFSSILAFGYGSPLFHYYPPLASYVAALFVSLGAGYVTAFKLTLSLALFLSAMGMYRLTRLVQLAPGVAAMSALTYALAPYQLSTLYLRGASAEILAMALLPWILWSFYGLLQQGGRQWFVLASSMLAALFVTHNAQSLFFVPVLLLFCALVMFKQWISTHPVQGERDIEERKSKRATEAGAFSGRSARLVSVVAALGLALALSLFFWLPALLERSYVNISALSTGFYSPLTHLLTWADLIQSTLGFDYDRSTAFRAGWLPLVLAVGGVLATIRLKQQRWLALFAVSLIVVSLGLQLQASAPFWQTLPLVSFIQFPWRLLSFVSLGVAILVGLLADMLSCIPGGRIVRTGGCTLLAMAVMGYSLGGIGKIVGVERERGIFNEGDVGYRDLYERGRLGFELFSDYQPVTVRLPMTEIPNSPSQTEHEAILAIKPEIRLVHYQGLNFKAEIDTDQPFVLSLNRVNFPGWQVMINGQRVAANSVGELGLLGMSVPKGRRQIEASWKSTTPVLASELFSQVALALWLGLLLMVLLPSVSWHWFNKVLAGIGVVLIFNLQIFLPRTPLAYAIERDATIADSVRLLGYSIDEEKYQPGDTIHLTLYWLAMQSIDRQYKVFVHLRDLSDTHMAAQHDGAPVYGFTPTTRWNPGQIIDDVHPLPLDATLAPGIYQLVVGMYDAETLQNLPVEAETELAGERVVLGQIEVK